MELDHVTHNSLLLTQTTRGEIDEEDQEKVANYGQLVLILDDKSQEGRLTNVTAAGLISVEVWWNLGTTKS